MLRRTFFAVLALVAGVALAQSDSQRAGSRGALVRCECHAIPGASTTVFAVAIHHGLDDDAVAHAGSARVLAQCRLERGRLALDGGVAEREKQSGLHVGSDLAVVFVQVRENEWARGCAFVEAMFDAERRLAPDVVELAIARAALVADDAAWLYPGPVLQSKARLALFDDYRARAVQGSARAVQALGPERVRRELARPVRVEVAAFGAIPPALREHRFALPAAPVARRAVVANVRTQEAQPDLTPHPRVDNPFAAIAFALPIALDWPAFAVAVEVARLRAVKLLPGVQDQVMARAPAVSWSWLEGDAAIVFCRRAHPEDGVDAAFGELDRLLAELAAGPPTERELEKARRSLLGELSPLPFGAELQAALARSPAALPGRAVAAMRSRHRAVTAVAITDVTAARAHRVWRAALDPARSWRGGLLPAPRPRPAWRR